MFMNLRVSPASGSFSFDVVSAYPQPEDARLLLVDDDPDVLGSLRRTLTDKSWDIVALRDPQAALQEVDSQARGHRSHGHEHGLMSGATLLGASSSATRTSPASSCRPHGSEAVLRAVPFAHSPLAKPLDTDVLRWTLRRACGLRKLLTSETDPRGGRCEQRDARRAGHVPALKQLLRDPQVALSEIATVAERDVGVSARTCSSSARRSSGCLVA